MAEQMHPASKDQAPDPSHSYERAHPGRESASGKLEGEADKATPTESHDKSVAETPNRQDGSRQINAHDVTDGRAEH